MKINLLKKLIFNGTKLKLKRVFSPLEWTKQKTPAFLGQVKIFLLVHHFPRLFKYSRAGLRTLQSARLAHQCST